MDVYTVMKKIENDHNLLTNTHRKIIVVARNTNLFYGLYHLSAVFVVYQASVKGICSLHALVNIGK